MGRELSRLILVLALSISLTQAGLSGIGSSYYVGEKVSVSYSEVVGGNCATYPWCEIRYTKHEECCNSADNEGNYQYATKRKNSVKKGNQLSTDFNFNVVQDMTYGPSDETSKDRLGKFDIYIYCNAPTSCEKFGYWRSSSSTKSWTAKPLPSCTPSKPVINAKNLVYQNGKLSFDVKVTNNKCEDIYVTYYKTVDGDEKGTKIWSNPVAPKTSETGDDSISEKYVGSHTLKVCLGDSLGGDCDSENFDGEPTPTPTLIPTPTPTPIPTGCQYNNPACDSNHDCVNNECVLKPGCNYGNPSCPSDQDCTNNQCIPKTGCQYHNPDCAANEDCLSNSCVPAACDITSTSWSKTSPVANGDAVNMVVDTTKGCNGKQVKYDVFEAELWPLNDKHMPPSLYATVTNSKATTSWTADSTPDFWSTDPEYYFNAVVDGKTKKSSELKVTPTNGCTIYTAKWEKTTAASGETADGKIKTSSTCNGWPVNVTFYRVRYLSDDYINSITVTPQNDEGTFSFQTPITASNDEYYFTAKRDFSTKESNKLEVTACSIRCSSNSNCDDGDVETSDTCNSPGTCSASCSHQPACVVKELKADPSAIANGQSTTFKLSTTQGCNGKNAKFEVIHGLTRLGDIVKTQDKTISNGYAEITFTPTQSTSQEEYFARTTVDGLDTFYQPDHLTVGACPVTCSSNQQCNDGKEDTLDQCTNPSTCNAACTNTLQCRITHADWNKAKAFYGDPVKLKIETNDACNEKTALIKIFEEDYVTLDDQVGTTTGTVRNNQLEASWVINGGKGPADVLQYYFIASIDSSEKTSPILPVEEKICEITNARWTDTRGETITLATQWNSVEITADATESCSQKTFLAEVWEDDPLWFNEDIEDVALTYHNGKLTGTWKAKFFKDNSGWPEFFFKIKELNKQDLIAKSKTIKVSPAEQQKYFADLSSIYEDKEITIVRPTVMSPEIALEYNALVEQLKQEATKVNTLTAYAGLCKGDPLLIHNLIVIATPDDELVQCIPANQTTNGQISTAVSPWAEGKHIIVLYTPNDLPQAITAFRLMVSEGTSPKWTWWDTTTACLATGDFDGSRAPFTSELICNVIPIVELIPDVRDSISCSYRLGAKMGMPSVLLSLEDFINVKLCQLTWGAFAYDVFGLAADATGVGAALEVAGDSASQVFLKGTKRAIEKFGRGVMETAVKTYWQAPKKFTKSIYEIAKQYTLGEFTQDHAAAVIKLLSEEKNVAVNAFELAEMLAKRANPVKLSSKALEGLATMAKISEFANLKIIFSEAMTPKQIEHILERWHDYGMAQKIERIYEKLGVDKTKITYIHFQPEITEWVEAMGLYYFKDAGKEGIFLRVNPFEEDAALFSKAYKDVMGEELASDKILTEMLMKSGVPHEISHAVTEHVLKQWGVDVLYKGRNFIEVVNDFHALQKLKAIGGADYDEYLNGVKMQLRLAFRKTASKTEWFDPYAQEQKRLFHQAYAMARIIDDKALVKEIEEEIEKRSREYFEKSITKNYFPDETIRQARINENIKRTKQEIDAVSNKWINDAKLVVEDMARKATTPSPEVQALINEGVFMKASNSPLTFLIFPTSWIFPKIVLNQTPTPSPTLQPTALPTSTPSPSPTPSPTPLPSLTPQPTASPRPTSTPTPQSTITPTIQPTTTPTWRPTATPTPIVTPSPTTRPTATPKCLQQYDPVCGVNNQTYQNECYARNANIEIAYRGVCNATTTPTPQPTPSPSPSASPSPTHSPTTTPTITPTPAPTLQPTPSPTITPQPTITPSPSPTPQPTPGFCITLYEPVCGADNQTYSNECFAGVAGVRVAHVGECNSTQAAPDLAITGIKASEKFVANNGTVSFNVTNLGSQTTPESFGEYFITHSNASASYERSVVFSIQPLAPNETKQFVIIFESLPEGTSKFNLVIDGSRQVAESNELNNNASIAIEIREDSQTPTPTPSNCTGQYRPVCGVNGVTYPEACDAQAAGIAIDHQGVCSIPTATPTTSPNSTTPIVNTPTPTPSNSTPTIMPSINCVIKTFDQEPILLSEEATYYVECRQNNNLTTCPAIVWTANEASISVTQGAEAVIIPDSLTSNLFVSGSGFSCNKTIQAIDVYANPSPSPTPTPKPVLLPDLIVEKITELGNVTTNGGKVNVTIRNVGQANASTFFVLISFWKWNGATAMTDDVSVKPLEIGEAANVTINLPETGYSWLGPGKYGFEATANTGWYGMYMPRESNHANNKRFKIIDVLPTPRPAASPTPTPSQIPSPNPTPQPTASPTATLQPTHTPTPSPTIKPSPTPTITPQPTSTPPQSPLHPLELLVNFTLEQIDARMNGQYLTYLRVVARNNQVNGTIAYRYYNVETNATIEEGNETVNLLPYYMQAKQYVIPRTPQGNYTLIGSFALNQQDAVDAVQLKGAKGIVRTIPYNVTAPTPAPTASPTQVNNTKPDLAIESLDATQPFYPAGGSIGATITNHGNTTAAESYVMFRIYGSRLEYWQREPIPPLEKNSAHGITRNIGRIVSGPGGYVLTATIDSGKQVDESDELNNDKAARFEIATGGPGMQTYCMPDFDEEGSQPDLTAHPQVWPTTNSVGNPHLTIEVKNNGAVRSRVSEVNYGIRKTDSTKHDLLAGVLVPELDPGCSYLVYLTNYNIYSGNGEYKVFGNADSTREVSEPDENNFNEASFTIPYDQPTGTPQPTPRVDGGAPTRNGGGFSPGGWGGSGDNGGGSDAGR